MTSISEKLLSLGDPSGQQTSSYWNQWFDIVCKSSNRTSFEWYTDVEEVSRILKSHSLHNNSNCESKTGNNHLNKPLRFIHPGSGNSLLPLHLRAVYPNSQHEVVDISDFAIQDMISNLEEQILLNSSNQDDNSISNHENLNINWKVENILRPPLSYSNEYFDYWLDKGLLDALFSGKEDSLSTDNDQCKELFQEAYRLLKRCGIVCIITMAEEHSLNLILSNWLQMNERGVETTPINSKPIWNKTLHIFEATPSSGSMRPFAFILQKHSIDNETKYPWNVLYHSIDSIEPISLFVQHHDDEINNNTYKSSDCISFLPRIKEVVQQKLNESRQSFQRYSMNNDLIKNNESSSTDDENFHLLLATIDIKPSDDEIDLSQLCKRITSSSWNIKSLKWYQQSIDDVVTNNNEDTDSWARYGTIVPIGYGINKLVLRCVIDSNDLEILCEAILEQESYGEEYNVQSVDIVWDDTFPVGDVRDFVKK